MANHRESHQELGFVYIHEAVDDHTRLAYAEVLPDESRSSYGSPCSAPVRVGL